MKMFGICVWMFLTMGFIVACSSWWFVFITEMFLFSEDQLGYVMAWGAISNLGMAFVIVGWIIYLLVKIVKRFAESVEKNKSEPQIH